MQLEARETDATERGSLRVLVIDDEPDIRFVVGLLMRRAGHEVVGEAEHGRRGIELAGRVRPQVIVLDMMMPIMSGREALPGLTACCPGAMVVVFSASATANNRREMLAGGAFAYYDKGQMARLPQLISEDYLRFDDVLR